MGEYPQSCATTSSPTITLEKLLFDTAIAAARVQRNFGTAVPLSSMMENIFRLCEQSKTSAKKLSSQIKELQEARMQKLCEVWHADPCDLELVRLQLLELRDALNERAAQLTINIQAFAAKRRR